MSLIEDYIRVSRLKRCPVCGKADWCLISRDGLFAICPRTPSEHEAGQSGFKHALTGEAAETMKVYASSVALLPPRPVIDATAMAEEFQHEIRDDALAAHAASLGVSVDSLVALGIGYSQQCDAWSFPMRSGGGPIIGIRLRNAKAKKWAITGSWNGLFYSPAALRGAKTILFPEGPTSTAALMDLGYVTVGRCSARGSARDVLEILTAYKPELVVIVGDVDAPDKNGHQAGIEGAADLANKVWSVNGWKTKLIFPRRGKDSRAWLQAGATRGEVDAMISNAPLWLGRDK